MDSSQLGQVLSLLQNRAADGVAPRRMPTSEIEQLISAAALLGEGRAQGFNDEEILGNFARGLVRERDRRLGGVSEGVATAEKALREGGLAPDDIEAKSAVEMLRDEADFGFAFEEDAQLAADGKRNVDRNAGLRERLAKVRGQRAGKSRDARIEKLQGRIADNASQQKEFDFGLIPIVGEDEDPVSPRERGRFVQRQDGLFFEQGGGFIEGPNGRIEIPARRVKAERDEDGRPILPSDIRMNPDFPTGAPEGVIKELVNQDRAMAQSEVRRFERYERGDLTEEEMQQRARLEAGRIDNSPLVKETPVVGVPADVPRPKQPSIDVFFREFVKGQEPILRRARPQLFVENHFRDGAGKGEEFDIRPQKKIVRHPGVGSEISPDEAQAAILGQLRDRKANQGAGRREQQIRNLLNALDEAEGNLVANAMPGPAGVAPNETIREGRVEFGGIDAPNVHQVGDVLVGGGGKVNALGQLKADRQKNDMGLQLGDQRAIVGKAIRVEMPDGSFRFVDAAGNDLAAPYKEQQKVNLAENLNAPDGANNAVDFVLKNQFEDRGAQFFGDESILGQMNDKGAGGGIEQVDIQGALRGIEEKVAAKLGIAPKRINNVQGFQAAMNAVVANEQAKGRALIRLEDGKKVKVDNPGVEEALLALKVNPAEGRAIANALKQKELAVGEQVSIPGVKHAGHDVVTGVNDPRRGGDRLDIAKDVAWQGKVIRQGFDPVNKGPLQGEAIKPFIGLLDGDARRPNGNQVFRGMDPAELRIMLEARNRGNLAKRNKALAKKGARAVPDRRGEVARIRQMQEGNVMAGLRNERDQAAIAARPVQDQKGNMVRQPGAVPPPIRMEERPGRARAPHPKARLKDRPVFRGDRQNMNPNPNVVEDGAANVELPKGYGVRDEVSRRLKQEIASNVVQKQDRRRRIGYGIGGGAAALATVLGLTNNQEEEQY